MVVHYSTEDDTAIAGVDYVAKSGEFTLLPGQTSINIDVFVYNPVPERMTKQFKLVLSQVYGNANLPNVPYALCILNAGEVEGGIIILEGLIANSWHDELGRGGYFHTNSGTSEGQSIGIEGSLLSYEILNGGTELEQDAADWYLQNAKNMLDALGDGSSNSPCLRIPVPDNPNQITLLHWLFAAKGPIPGQGINYKFKATKNAQNKLIIPATVPPGENGENHKGSADVFRVWRIYPQTSTLLYTSPYSPAYDDEKPIGDTTIPMDEHAVEGTSPHWKLVGDNIEITIPSGAPSTVTAWYVIYGYNNAETIPQHAAQEAYPCWTKIDPGYSACAPDTFRWFDVALNLAIEHDTRPGANEKWTKLRNASRKTAVRGQSLSDLREVIKPLPKFDVIPINAEPSGFFCYSDHPGAQPPPSELIAKGANVGWTGYNFWSRIGGVAPSAAPDVFYWTPQVMFSPTEWRESIYNGAIQGTVPAASGDTVYQVQLGRGFNDEWRVQTTYQQPDQFVFLAFEIDKKPAEGEHFYVYLSTTKYYSGETRYYADIGHFDSFETGPSSDGGPRYMLIPRTEFKRKDLDNQVLPAGSRFENFGISAEFKGTTGYTVKIVALRIVGGPSAQWVYDNFVKAVKGGDLPFFPGAIPFATNAYMEKQQFVGWNGNPFHGYQLADFWWFCGDEADQVHPNLTVSDLAVVSNAATGALSYPIQPNTRLGSAKPKNALLMEQQLLFLKYAQDQHKTDGGLEGLFAHTFVLNTAARMTLGNPRPHSWIYINDDPNTRWCGYVSRVIDTLGKIVYLTKDNTGFLDCREMALEIVIKWLTQLNQLWPNLSGKTVNGKTIYGAPTDYDDPRKKAPETLYEEPHSPSLVLRGCIWLKLSGQLSADQLTLVNTIGKRCFDYLAIRWNDTPGHIMQYSWANQDDQGKNQYYGFWIFEILSTLAYMLKNPAGAPTGVDLDLARKYIRQHKTWLVRNVH